MTFVFKINNTTNIDSSAVIASNTEISDKDKLWFDLNHEKPRIYHPIKLKWGFLNYGIGYDGFDNNISGFWTSYISIPISSQISTSTQVKVVIKDGEILLYTNNMNLENFNISDFVFRYSINTNKFWKYVDLLGSDIRIFDETMEQTYFWIEKIDKFNRECVIWTKVNAGQETINIGFGNTDCIHSQYNDGSSVFNFFDDFIGNEIDKNKWYYGGSIKVENSSVKMFPGKIQSKQSFSGNFIVNFKAMVTSNSYYHTDHITVGLLDSDRSDGYGFWPFFRKDGVFQFYWRKPNYWQSIGVYSHWSPNQWVKIENIRFGNRFGTIIGDYDTDTMEFYLIESPSDVTIGDNIFFHCPRMWVEFNDGDGPFILDYIFVREIINEKITFDKPQILDF